MASLDELKARRLAELQRAQSQGVQVDQELQQEYALQQQIAQLEAAVKQHLSREALERFGNIKTAHPEMALQVIAVLARLVQGGKITGEISDEQFKQILQQITPKKRDIRISRVPK